MNFDVSVSQHDKISDQNSGTLEEASSLHNKCFVTGNTLTVLFQKSVD